MRCRWYKRMYGKPFKHFFKKGFKQGLHIKIIAPKLSPLKHYCTLGWKEGRRLRLRSSVGTFDGVVNMEAFLEVGVGRHTHRPPENSRKKRACMRREHEHVTSIDAPSCFQIYT